MSLTVKEENMKQSFSFNSINKRENTLTTINKEGNMKRIISIIAAVICLAVAAPVFAMQYTFDTSSATNTWLHNSGLSDDNNFAWNLPLTLSQGETITSAVISIKNLQNWQNNVNHLYVNFLKNPDNVVTTPTSITNEGNSINGSSNDFAYSSLANHFSGAILNNDFSLPWDGTNDATVKRDVTYTTTSQSVLVFLKDAANGSFAVGFDPDCHFNADSMELQINTTTSTVPEPSTLLLLGVGVAGICFIRMKRSRAFTS